MKVVVVPTVGRIAEWGEICRGWQPVVIDVLRATSTIATALVAGAVAVLPRRTPEEVDAEARLRAHERLLRAGERGGVRIPGFDLGNSPLEFVVSVVAGRAIGFTTTNGTQALDEAAALGEVACAAFLNRIAVVRWLYARGRDVVIVCAGTEGAFSADDVCAAGAIIEALRRLEPAIEVDDLGLTAEHGYRDVAGNLVDFLARTRHGRRLLDMGFVDDLAACAAIDGLDVVPVCRDGVITASSVCAH